MHNQCNYLYLTDDESLDKVYISTKSLMMIGALPEKIIISLNLSPDEGMVMSPLLQENKGTILKIIIDFY